MMPLFILPMIHPYGLLVAILLAAVLTVLESGVRQAGVLFLMLTLMAAVIKTSPLNPVPEFLDLTVLFFALFICTALVYILFRRWHFPKPVLLDALFGLFILIVILQYFHAPHAVKDYSGYKLVRFLFLSAPFYLIPRLLNMDDFRMFSRLTALLGGFICIALFLAFPNVYAMKASGSSYLTIAAGAGVVMMFAATHFVQDKRILWKFVFLLAMLGSLILVFKTNSRGGMLFAPLVLFFYLMHVFRRKRVLVVVAVVILVAATLLTYAVFPDFFERFFLIFKRHKGSSISTRFVMYRVALNLLSERFFTGIGLGGFSHYHFLLYPHNLILEVFLEHGLFGGLAFTGILGGFGLRWLRLFRSGAMTDYRAPYLLSAVFMLLFQMTSFGLESTRLFMFFMGCVVASSSLSNSDSLSPAYQQKPVIPGTDIP